MHAPPRPRCWPPGLFAHRAVVGGSPATAAVPPGPVTPPSGGAHGGGDQKGEGGGILDSTSSIKPLAHSRLTPARLTAGRTLSRLWAGATQGLWPVLLLCIPSSELGTGWQVRHAPALCFFPAPPTRTTRASPLLRFRGKPPALVAPSRTLRAGKAPSRDVPSPAPLAAVATAAADQPLTLAFSRMAWQFHISRSHILLLSLIITSSVDACSSWGGTQLQPARGS